MLLLKIVFRSCLFFVFSGICWAYLSLGQSLPIKHDGGFLAADSLALAIPILLSDSLEIALLRTTKTYQQVERLLSILPPESPYLDLLPSVLPVDVPLQAFRISSPFGLRRHSIRQQIQMHDGVDVKASLGMPVKATAEGIVKRVGNDPTLGVFVQLRHAFGFETTYGHLSGYCVKPGEVVKRNQELGRVGQTGIATGAHLHYVIHKEKRVRCGPVRFLFSAAPSALVLSGKIEDHGRLRAGTGKLFVF